MKNLTSKSLMISISICLLFSSLFAFSASIDMQDSANSALIGDCSREVITPEKFEIVSQELFQQDKEMIEKLISRIYKKASEKLAIK